MKKSVVRWCVVWLCLGCETVTHRGDGGGNVPDSASRDATMAADDDSGGVDAGRAQAAIGPAGGTLELLGVLLEIPEAALSDEVMITVEVVEAPEHPAFEPVGPFFDFGPDGTQFSIPALLTLPTDAQLLGDQTPEDLGVVRLDDLGEVAGLPFIIGEGETLLIPIEHFTTIGPALVDPLGPCCLESGCELLKKRSCETKALEEERRLGVDKEWAELRPRFLGAFTSCANSCDLQVCCQVSRKEGLGINVALANWSDCAMIGLLSSVEVEFLQESACKKDVCCSTGDGRDAVFLAERDQCRFQAPDPSACASRTCCGVLGGARVVEPGECLQELLPDEACEDVCCELEGGGRIVEKRETCRSRSGLRGVPLSLDQCTEALVCCLEDGQIKSGLECEGTTLPLNSPECTDAIVCCANDLNPNKPEILLATKSDCEQKLGFVLGELGSDHCGGAICCELGSEFLHYPRELCTLLGGKVVDALGGIFDKLLCGGGTTTELPREEGLEEEQREKLEALFEDERDDGPVCCMVGTTPLVMARQACLFRGVDLGHSGDLPLGTICSFLPDEDRDPDVGGAGGNAGSGGSSGAPVGGQGGQDVTITTSAGGSGGADPTSTGGQGGLTAGTGGTAFGGFGGTDFGGRGGTGAGNFGGASPGGTGGDGTAGDTTAGASGAAGSENGGAGGTSGSGGTSGDGNNAGSGGDTDSPATCTCNSAAGFDFVAAAGTCTDPGDQEIMRNMCSAANTPETEDGAIFVAFDCRLRIHC